MAEKTILSNAHKDSIRRARTGTKHSQETIEKMREAWIRRKERSKKTVNVH